MKEQFDRKTGEKPFRGGQPPRIPKLKMAPHLELNFMVFGITVENFMRLSQFSSEIRPTGEPPFRGETPRIPKFKMAPHLELNFMVFGITVENFMRLSQFASEIHTFPLLTITPFLYLLSVLFMQKL